jgi:acyl carrier protein
MSDSVLCTVRDFISKNYYVPDADALVGDASLVDKGILDSTGVIELAAFLEGEFGIKIADAELLPENLDTLDRVVAFVARKREARVA